MYRPAAAASLRTSRTLCVGRADGRSRQLTSYARSDNVARHLLRSRPTGKTYICQQTCSLQTSSVAPAQSLSHSPQMTSFPTSAGMSDLLTSHHLFNIPLEDRLRRIDDVKTLLERKETEAYSSSTPADTTMPKARRHGFPAFPALIRQIDQGQVIAPMSEFYKVASVHLLGRAAIDSVKVDQTMINNLLQALSKASVRHEGRLDNIKQLFQSQHTWRPAQIARNVDVGTVPAHELRVYALTTVYDVASTLGIMPSTVSTAAMLGALSLHLDIRTFAKCLSLILLQLSGLPFHEATAHAQRRAMVFSQFDAQKVPKEILSAVIGAFGNLGKPELGEQFLLWWSKAYPDREARDDFGLPTLQVDCPEQLGMPGPIIPSRHWCGDQGVWSALIRSRAAVNDWASARHWLQQYRSIVRHAHERSSQPYLEYARCCSRADQFTVEDIKVKSLHVDSSGKGLKYLYLREALQMIAEDGIVVNERLFCHMINIEIGYGRTKEAALIIQKALANKLVRLTTALCKALFRAFRISAVRNHGDESLFDKTAIRSMADYPALRSIRSLFHVVKTYHTYKLWPRAGKKDKKRSPAAMYGIMEEGLKCALTLGDLPLALAMYDFIGQERLSYDVRANSALLYWLERCHRGYGGAHISPNQPIDQGANVSPTLQCAGASMSPRDSMPNFLALQSDVGSVDNVDKAQICDVRERIAARLIDCVRAASHMTALQRRQKCAPWVTHICAIIQTSGKSNDPSDTFILDTALSAVPRRQ